MEVYPATRFRGTKLVKCNFRAFQSWIELAAGGLSVLKDIISSVVKTSVLTVFITNLS